MPVYFFDSSVIVKRYATETGTAWIKSIAIPTAGNRIYLARITGAEVVAAISRRARSGEMSPADVTISITEFRYHLIHEYRIIEITPRLIDSAMNLAQTYVLRGYDAVQLAAAMDVNSYWVSTGMPPITLISADNSLNTAATAEGLVVDNPNDHL